MHARVILFLVAAFNCMFGLNKPAYAQNNKKPDTTKSLPRKINVTSWQLASFSKQSEASVRGRVGKLKWLGGLVLSSDDPAFGGYSGIEMSPDGQGFIAVSVDLR